MDLSSESVLSSSTSDDPTGLGHNTVGQNQSDLMSHKNKNVPQNWEVTEIS
eukprot:TRINITY_DN358_c1_g1_i1.p4 TRINITY_DN358_c1_g1~~TRINITY_DN358_c1_g1_i1.p4  ORF type:complete len:51 (-),score=7.67 TRINITY_DN358_c1_g1_i1:237-389(-)